ncbi:biosynthetic-type acetolactate synthase large subunit [Gammaproteobacteria bacterium]|nr:biosynthetic-type acetolactate synthase large subunit [Gammaproteobacteria bacterium]
MKLTGAEILLKALADEGVEYVFGYPGGAALHIYDALHRQDRVQHVLVRHEQGATHAADGYARSTGRPGVVLVTSGPGITNTVTGIATAHLDSIPMVVISGQVPRELIGNDAFQEVDATGITRPCVKHNFLVTSAADVAETIKKAFHIACTGRPGPVLVDVPKDVTAELAEYHYPESVHLRSYQPTRQGHPKQIRRAAELLLSAKKPVIYTGGGVQLAGADAALVELVRELGYPCTNTLMGLGSYPHDDPLFIGMLGMHGTYEANMAMHDCDVMLAIGARFDDRVTGDTAKFAPDAQIIHVDIDPASIGKTVACTVPIVGSADQVIPSLIDAIRASKTEQDDKSIAGWWGQINEWRGFDSLGYDASDEVIKPQYVVQMLHKVTGGEAFITSDVGQHQMWAAQHYGFSKPRRWINSGGLGTMGFGLPAAIGVKFAHPDATVACVTGEASIQMCIQELSTALQYNTPVIVVNLNNRYLGMVRQWQEFFYDRRYSHSYMDSIPDFVKLAEAYGHRGLKIENPADVEGAIEQAVKDKNRTWFLDFITDQTENVYPMIAAGKGHHEMDLHPNRPAKTSGGQ